MSGATGRAFAPFDLHEPGLTALYAEHQNRHPRRTLGFPTEHKSVLATDWQASKRRDVGKHKCQRAENL